MTTQRVVRTTASTLNVFSLHPLFTDVRPAHPRTTQRVVRTTSSTLNSFSLHTPLHLKLRLCPLFSSSSWLEVLVSASGPSAEKPSPSTFSNWSPQKPYSKRPFFESSHSPQSHLISSFSPITSRSPASAKPCPASPKALSFQSRLSAIPPLRLP